MADLKDVQLVEPIKKSVPNSRTLTLGKVWAATPDKYKERSKTAKFKSLKRRRSIETGRQVILSVIYTTHDHAGNKKEAPDYHYQQIEQLNGRKTLWTSKCKVSCSCLDFLFTDEVSLYKRANTNIMFSNGELPVIKNPKLVPQVCKHLVRLMIMMKLKGW